jgi:shikimate dehydrogenase
MESGSHVFGLIGKSLTHSFSKDYFNEKFKELGLDDHKYVNFELSAIEEFPSLISSAVGLRGLNVTIPYKETVIPFLDEIAEVAKEIGAVNCISIKNKRLKGHNTDAYGFAAAIRPYLRAHHTRALILGTGGSSRAVTYALGRMGMDVTLVSTNPSGKPAAIGYGDLDAGVMAEHGLLVNTTPLGMFPDGGGFPPIPYEHLNPRHLVFDLVYNPAQTVFLSRASEKGATTSNGLEMLRLQAEKSWEIWNSG